MAGVTTDLLRAGLALKLRQVKLATRSYVRDRAQLTIGTVESYAIGAAFFATAGVFLIAASFVGAMALFRWVEMSYGVFPAFGTVGGVLVAIAIVCAAAATFTLKRPARSFPSLGSRLRVAINANSVGFRPGLVDQEKAASNSTSSPLLQSYPRLMGVGLILFGTVLGLLTVRRRQRMNRRIDGDHLDRT